MVEKIIRYPSFPIQVIWEFTVQLIVGHPHATIATYCHWIPAGLATSLFRTVLGVIFCGPDGPGLVRFLLTNVDHTLC